jgi:hypothetical protein
MTHTNYDLALENADETLRCLLVVAEELPLGDLRDCAANYGFSQEMLDGLDKLMAAAAVLVLDGPDVIDAFAKAAGMRDGLTVREQAHQEERRASVAAYQDPNSLLNLFRGV